MCCFQINQIVFSRKKLFVFKVTFQNDTILSYNHDIVTLQDFLC